MLIGSISIRGGARFRSGSIRRKRHKNKSNPGKSPSETVPDMPPSTTPGEIATGWFQSCGSDVGLRHVMSGSALPTILQSASRRADISELPGSLLLRPVKLLAPCADLTRTLPATGTFTSRLPTSRSPFSPLDITTTVTGLFCRWDSHPLE